VARRGNGGQIDSRADACTIRLASDSLVVMDPLSLATVVLAAKDIKTLYSIVDRVLHFQAPRTKDLEKARKEMIEWWVSELAGRAAEQVSYLEKVGADLEKVKSILTSPEFHRVFSNYVFEAACFAAS
jgi:hypothetical protein